MAIGNGTKIVLGGIAAWWIYQKYIFTQSVNFKIVTIKFGGSFFSPEIILEIMITNPSAVSTTISNIQAAAYTNNTKISDIFYNDPIVIGAKSQVAISLTLNPKLANLITSISEMIKAKNGSIQLKGMATIDGIPLPFNINYSM